MRKGGIVSKYVYTYVHGCGCGDARVEVGARRVEWGGVGRGEVSEAGTNSSGCEENGRDLAPLPLPLQR